MARRGEFHPDAPTAEIAKRWARGARQDARRGLIKVALLEGVVEVVVIGGGGDPLLGLFPGLGVAAGLWWSNVRCAGLILNLSRDS